MDTTNKPVAWINKDTLDATHIIKAVVRREQDEHHKIPLYTHPVKELTDEEIVETVKDHFIGAIKVGIVLTNDNVLDFARAILRKAQEK